MIGGCGWQATRGGGGRRHLDEGGAGRLHVVGVLHAWSLAVITRAYLQVSCHFPTSQATFNSIGARQLTGDISAATVCRAARWEVSCSWSSSRWGRPSGSCSNNNQTCVSINHIHPRNKTKNIQHTFGILLILLISSQEKMFSPRL